MNRIASFEQQFRQEIAVLTADSCYQYFFAQRLNAIAIGNAARQRFSWHEGVPSLASQAVLAGRIEKKVEVSQGLELGSAFAINGLRRDSLLLFSELRAKAGAGRRNRTDATSLEGWGSTTKLYPRKRRLKIERLAVTSSPFLTNLL